MDKEPLLFPDRVRLQSDADDSGNLSLADDFLLPPLPRTSKVLLTRTICGDSMGCWCRLQSQRRRRVR